MIADIAGGHIAMVSEALLQRFSLGFFYNVIDVSP
jgi:hypothetical protein